jgi:HEAT repeat protein
MSDSSTDTDEPLAGLGSDAWRDRKRASDALVQELHRMQTQEAPDAAHGLFSKIVDVVIAPSTPSARAAASEVLTRLGGASVPHLRAALDRHPDATRPLIEVLGMVGGAAELPLFSDYFKRADGDENLRCALVTAIARQRGEQSLKLLHEMLEDSSEVVTLHVLDGYTSVGGTPPAGVLAELLERPTLRRSTIEVLGNSTEESALALVWSQLSDGLPGIRGLAARSMTRLISTRFEAEADATAYLGSLEIDEGTLHGIASLLEHTDDRAVVAAAKLLALIGKEESFGRLLQVVHLDEVLEAARRLLGRVGSTGREELSAALQRDRDNRCYAQWVELVGALSPDEVDDDLVSLLERELTGADEVVVASAIRSLGSVGASSHLPALLECCGRDDGLGDMAADAVADLLTRAGELEVPLSALQGNRWPSSGSLARNLCRVAGRLGNESSVASLVFLLTSSDVDVRVAAAHALGEIPGAHEGAGALAFALADEEAHVRAAACRSLGALGRIESLNSLLAASADASSLVRAAAVQALVQLNNPVAATRMREIILEDSSPTVVVHAVEGLQVVQDEQTLGLVMSLCTSSDTEVAKAAARVLRGFPSHRATAALIGLLAHERWDVRWAAAESLGMRDDPTAVGAIREVLTIEADALVARTLQETLNHLLDSSSQEEHG